MSTRSESGAQGRAAILVVDDTPQNLQVLGAILDETGYDVRVASNGPTALTIARVSPPDLILLDILMPGMDGYAVCGALKNDASLADRKSVV